MAQQQADVEEQNREMSRLLEALQQEREGADRQRQEALNVAEERDGQRAHLAACVDTMLEAMDRFAEGDLTEHLPTAGDDAIGRLFDGFNRTVVNIRDMLNGVMHAVASTARASNEISLSKEQLPASVQEQSASSEQISRSAETISTVSQESAEGISQISHSTDSLNKLTEELRAAVLRFRVDDAPRDRTASVRGDGTGSVEPEVEPA